MTDFLKSIIGSDDDVPCLPTDNPTRSFWHTSHPNDLTKHRTTPGLPSTGRVAIVGSGITGVFAAQELVARGVSDIVVLEARDVCSGATGRVSRWWWWWWWWCGETKSIIALRNLITVRADI